MENLKLKLEEYVNTNLPKGWLPYYIYEIIVDDQVVGKITLREGTCEQRYFDGHIGYSIDKNYRGHHYSYYALNEVIEIAWQKKFNELIITTDPSNIASKKNIQRVGKYIETLEIPKSLKKDFSDEEKLKEIYKISRV